MMAVVTRPITRRNPYQAWIEPGIYKVIRWFDSTRLIIDVSRAGYHYRVITLVNIGEVSLNNDSLVIDYDYKDKP